ncbi:MAG TPA: type II toxin-antitoxin system PemK/MazF family toxin [Tepidisphaeraceae bacterium]|jgi:mRNA interferase MazF
MARPSRGEVWRADLEPVRGHEQGRVRPVLVISNDVFNHGNSNLVTIVPMTTKGRPLRSFLKIEPPEGGVSKTSFIMCDHVRTISADRLTRRFGAVSSRVLTEVELRLRYLMGL